MAHRDVNLVTLGIVLLDVFVKDFALQACLTKGSTSNSKLLSNKVDPCHDGLHVKWQKIRSLAFILWV